jgi:hypothetical protein
MKNQLFTGTNTSRRQLTLPNVGLKAGAPVLVGTEPFVLLDDYQANVAGCTGLFNGTFTLTVVGQTSESPQVTHQINPGDNIYAVGGTLDAATNVRYGFTLDANSSSGILFGRLEPSPLGGGPVAAGATALVGVQI